MNEAWRQVESRTVVRTPERSVGDRTVDHSSFMNEESLQYDTVRVKYKRLALYQLSYVGVSRRSSRTCSSEYEIRPHLWTDELKLIFTQK